MNDQTTTTSAEPAKKKLSPQQRYCVLWARDGEGSAFVQAVAGAGKTTLLMAMLRVIRGSYNLCAYNAKIAEEIRGKVAAMGLNSRQGRIGTFHSLGCSAWRRLHPEVRFGPEAAREKLDEVARYLGIDRRVQVLLDSNPGVVQDDDYPLQPERTYYHLRPLVEKLISLAKQWALGLHGDIGDRSRWHSIVDHFDLAYDVETEEDLDTAIELAIRGLRRHIEIGDRIIDFDDMIYLPVVKGIRMWQNDWVLVDEAQDTNPARRALARMMLKPGGRAVFVGDRRQAIYGFTGADSDAIDLIIRDFRCAELPLTVTFRCPKAVVRAAQSVVGHIQAHETAPEGEVATIRAAELEAPEVLDSLHPTDTAILCRKTKPLVELAYRLIRRGKACHVEGKDIGTGLLKLANRFAAKRLETLLSKLEAHAERECTKLVAKGRETQAEGLRDRVETLKVLAEGCQTVDDLKRRVLELFQDSKDEPRPTLTLSTVHKSKGREWPEVYVLGRDAWMPLACARQEWQKVQEDNLIYVAYTRAQRRLVLVNVEGNAAGDGPAETKELSDVLD